MHCDVVVQSSGRTAFMSKETWSRHLIVNIFLVIYIAFAILLNGGFSPITKRGFFCNDPTIQYPVKTDTISFKLLLVFALLLPMIVIKLCDKLLKGMIHSSYVRSERRRKISDMQDDPTSTDQKLFEVRARITRRLVVNDDEDAEEEQNLCKVCDSSDEEPRLVNQEKSIEKCVTKRSEGFSDLQLFLFGFATTAFYTGVGKMTCGRLRPHFMQRCIPNISCSLPENQNRYIEDFECTNNLRDRDVSYITTSWPSGKFAMTNHYTSLDYS